ncbi:MAG: hypothetical protein ABEH66_06655 [Halobacteriales archaeon]
METRDAVKWAGVYLGLWVLAVAVSGGFVVAGLALDALRVAGLGAYTPDVFQGGTMYPRAGIVLLGIGALVFQFGTALAGFKAGITAVEEETARHFDPEAMKSDILAVLDDRLADIHQEVSQTRQMVNRIGREETAEEFDFGDEL